MNHAFEIALKEYGVKEIPGIENNPRIMEYFEDIGMSWVQNDELAWCGCFHNWSHLKAGYVRSGRLDARSWLPIGKHLDVPTIGCTVILWRVAINDWRGHVGYFVSQVDELIYVLGGNQNNMVCIKAYPVNGDHYGLLEYRDTSIDLN